MTADDALGSIDLPGTPRLVGAPWGDTSRRGRPYAKDPSVIRFGGRYLLYCSLPSGSDDVAEGWSVAVAESDDLVSWRTVAVLPPFGDHDATGAAAPVPSCSTDACTCSSRRTAVVARTRSATP